MSQTLAHIALLVNNYDEAIGYYCNKLNFTLLEDTRLSETKRWVIVAPPGSTGFSLLLAQAATDEQRTRVSNQTGGRVFLFLHTDNFTDDYNRMKANGVQFIEQPRHETYGTVVVFADLYGNRWDLIERKNLY